MRRYGTVREAAASHPQVETLRGRGRVYVVPAPVGAARWVVRPYRRGGAVASLLDDRYLRIGTPRPVAELAVAWELEERDVPTPRHLGALVYPSGPWYRGDLVTELVPRSRDLAAVLFPGVAPPAASGSAPDEPVAAMRAAGRVVRQLHDAGVRHRDLNLKNLLIAEEADAEEAGAAGAVDSADAERAGAADSEPAGASGAVRALVLDLDRATVGRTVGPRARRRMLERFWRSARKWEAMSDRALDREWVVAFEDGYAGH